MVGFLGREGGGCCEGVEEGGVGVEREGEGSVKGSFEEGGEEGHVTS